MLFEKWKGYTIERIGDKHYPEMAAIYGNVYKKSFMPGYFQKKYATEHLGIKNIGCIAFTDKREPVATFLAIPWAFQYKSAQYLTTQSCDSATDPHHTGKGLSTRLGICTYELAKQENLLSTFGCPNQNSYHVLIGKLGWKVTTPLVRYTIPVGTLPLSGITGKIGLKKQYMQFVHHIFNTYRIPPVSFNSMETDDGLMVLRNEPYLQYKSGLGNFFIQIYETIFWIKIVANSLVIGDLKTTHEHEWKKAMKKLKWLCLKAGLRYIYFQSQKGSSEASYFSAHYREAASLQVGYLDFKSGLPLDQLKVTFADLDTF
ncbi:MAG: GNAT family N-acetyltransferase [Ferruginibacter sp.]|nr:GNAT family N-acetyltransferase [Chitinophagaceae bacterium]